MKYVPEKPDKKRLWKVRIEGEDPVDNSDDEDDEEEEDDEKEEL